MQTFPKHYSMGSRYGSIPEERGGGGGGGFGVAGFASVLTETVGGVEATGGMGEVGAETAG